MQYEKPNWNKVKELLKVIFSNSLEIFSIFALCFINLARAMQISDKDNKIKQGTALALTLILFTAMFSILVYPINAADPGHGPSAIGPGTFDTGSYAFPLNLSVSNNFSVSGSTFFVRDNGNVGIGTTNPSSRFEVAKVAGANEVNLSGVLYVNSTYGYVGIGTTSPAAYLHVVQSSGTYSPLFEALGNGQDILRLKNADENIVAKFTSDSTFSGNTNSGALLLNERFGATKILLASEGSSYFTGGNVGIGTTNPSSRFEVAKVAGTNEVNLSGVLYVNSTSGYVGIGTTGPANLLEIAGTGYGELDVSQYRNDASSNIVNFRKSRGTSVGTLATTNNGDALGAIYAQGVDSGNTAFRNAVIVQFEQDGAATATQIPSRITFKTNDGTGVTEKVRIDKNGNVGIGTTNPLATLLINSSNPDGSLRVKNISGQEHLFVNGSSGNVGIGTASPATRLTIDGSNTDGTLGLRVRNSGDTTYRGDFYSGGAAGMILNSYKDGTGYQKIQLDASPLAINVQSRSSVGIGTATPSNTLDVRGIGNFSGSLYVNNGTLVNTWLYNQSISPSTATWNKSGTNVFLNSLGDKVGIGTTNPSSRFEVAKVAGANEVNLSGVLYVNSTSGNVGIGTITPTEKLEVYPDTDNKAIIGRAKIGDIGWGDHAVFAHVDSFSTTGYALAQNPNGYTTINSPSSASSGIGFRIDNAEKMKITTAGDIDIGSGDLFVNTTSGNVGIGTATPSNTLDVRGIGNFSGSLYVNNETLVNTWLYNQSISPATATWNKTGTNVFLNSLGDKVGIGTTGPGYKLEVVDSAAPQMRISGYESILGGSSYSGELRFGTDSSAQGRIHYEGKVNNLFYIDHSYNNDAGDIYFRTKTAGTPVNALVIKGSGNVGIGTTSPRSKLDVIGNITTSGNITIPIPNSGVTFNNASRIYDNGTCLILAGRSSRIEVC